MRNEPLERRGAGAARDGGQRGRAPGERHAGAACCATFAARGGVGGRWACRAARWPSRSRAWARGRRRQGGWPRSRGASGRPRAGGAKRVASGGRFASARPRDRAVRGAGRAGALRLPQSAPRSPSSRACRRLHRPGVRTRDLAAARPSKTSHVCRRPTSSTARPARPTSCAAIFRPRSRSGIATSPSRRCLASPSRRATIVHRAVPAGRRAETQQRWPFRRRRLRLLPRRRGARSAGRALALSGPSAEATPPRREARGPGPSRQ